MSDDADPALAHTNDSNQCRSTRRSRRRSSLWLLRAPEWSFAIASNDLRDDPNIYLSKVNRIVRLSKSKYLCGDEISFADLLGYHELVSHVAGAILGDADWQKHPNVKRWFDTISERPHSKAVSEMIMQVGAMRLAGNLIPI